MASPLKDCAAHSDRCAGTREIRAKASAAAFLLIFAHAPGLHAGPLHDAVRAKDVAAIDQVLAAGVEIDETDYFVGPALHVAVSEGDTEMAGHLIARGADLESIGEAQGSRPLHIAAEFGDVAMVRLLLDKGAATDSRDADGRTPLFRAAARGHTGAAKLLLDRGADPTVAESTLGQMPLHRASDNGQVAMVQLLLDHGASVNALAGSGFSPLMLAAQSQSFSHVGDGSLLELLVAHGANLEKTNAHGQTPREYAAMRHEGPWRKIAAVLERLEQN